MVDVTRGVHRPLSQWCILHIPPFQQKNVISALFSFNLRFLLPPCFDHDVFMHHVLHVLDVPGCYPKKRVTDYDKFELVVSGILARKIRSQFPSGTIRRFTRNKVLDSLAAFASCPIPFKDLKTPDVSRSLYVPPFSHSGHFNSASSSPLLLRSTPDTARMLCRSVRRSTVGICEWRTCPRSLRGS